MQSTTLNQQTLLPKLYALPHKPKLYIKNTVFEQIKTLCSEISQVEWSGVLFHSSKGFVDNPNTFELTAEYILPMDKGTSGFTSYNFDDDYIDAISEKSELLNYSISHIHSHNNMGVFFSGTDNEELQENAPNYDYYLSLIVNNKMEMEARVAFVGKIKPREFVFKGKNGKLKKMVSEEEDVIFYYDMDIIVLYPEVIDEFFLKHMDRIQKKVPTRSINTNYIDAHYSPNVNNNSKKNNFHNTGSLAKDTNAINFIKFMIRKHFKSILTCKETDTLYAHLREIDDFSKAKKDNYKKVEEKEELLTDEFIYPYVYNMLHDEYIKKGIVFPDRSSDLISMCEEGYKILTESVQYSYFPLVATIAQLLDGVMEDFIEMDTQYKLKM